MKKTLYVPNCGVKLRSKNESSMILQERYEQLKLEGKGKSREAQLIFYIIRRSMAEAQN